MKSRSQIKRFRSQMECKHDIVERENAVTADGMCPLCMRKRIEELETKLAGRSTVTSRHMKAIEELMTKDRKQINELIKEVERLQKERKSERRKHSIDTGMQFVYKV